MPVGVGGVEWRIEGVLLGPGAGDRVVPAGSVVHLSGGAVLDAAFERVGVLCSRRRRSAGSRCLRTIRVESSLIFCHVLLGGKIRFRPRKCPVMVPLTGNMLREVT